jgi:outer membrane protein OmpA-like peptidoglycan-associated protein
MNRIERRVAWLAAVLAFALASPAHAGLGDKLKNKLKTKVEQKVEQKTDRTVDGATSDAEPAEGTESADAPTAGSGGEVSTVSTKFDYVPGDKVLLYDDFTQDDLGEFPKQFKLSLGNFEIVEQSGERWLRCTSSDGRIRMKAGRETLPEFWTLEFDFYATEPMGSALMVFGLAKDDWVAWEAAFPSGSAFVLRTGEIFSSTPLEGSAPPGRHHVMFMARGNGLKAYIDRQRVANVPEISPKSGTPVDLEIRLFASTQPMITNVRFAEGCRPPKDMLAEGKLVTYGIHFDSGSDVVLPDSAPVLRQIAAYMEANAAVKLTITGHTDDVGTAASNLDLSKRRAASVAKVLAEQFKIAADRFTTDGKGDTEKVAENATPAGRAMNRRVEFEKS